MGAAKAAMEVLTRYFGVALAGRGITVNTISPGWIEDSVLNSLPSTVQDGIRDWHKGGWTPMGRFGDACGCGERGHPAPCRVSEAPPSTSISCPVIQFASS